MISAHDPEKLQLLVMLKQAINFIETSQAVSGKLLNEEEWDKTVAEFKANSTHRIGIGRCYLDKAFIELGAARELIKRLDPQNVIPLSLSPEQA